MGKNIKSEGSVPKTVVKGTRPPADKTVKAAPEEISAEDLSPLTKARDFGQYKIVRELGRGGMCIVYEAYQPSLNRSVALKLLPHSLAKDKEFIERFRREAELAANLHHPNIAPIYEIGEVQGTYFYTMEYIRGKTLERVLQEENLDEPRKLEIIQQVGSALAYAHSKGIIHRDIKPSNIMIDENGRVLVTDFGLAKPTSDSRLTTTGTIMGTPMYMAPEQAKAENTDERSDIYSLGTVLYEALTGSPPFESDSPLNTIKKVIEEEPPAPAKINPSVPRDLQTITLKAMAKAPRDRYQSIEEFMEDIELYLKDLPIKAKPTSIFRKAQKTVKRHKAVTAVVLVATSILLTMALYSGHRISREISSLESEAKEAFLKAKESAYAENWEKAFSFISVARDKAGKLTARDEDNEIYKALAQQISLLGQKIDVKMEEVRKTREVLRQETEKEIQEAMTAVNRVLREGAKDEIPELWRKLEVSYRRALELRDKRDFSQASIKAVAVQKEAMELQRILKERRRQAEKTEKEIGEAKRAMDKVLKEGAKDEIPDLWKKLEIEYQQALELKDKKNFSKASIKAVEVQNEAVKLNRILKAKRRQAKKRAAEKAIEDAKLNLQGVNKKLAQKFAPGEIQKLEARMEKAYSALGREDFTTASKIAEEVKLDCQKLVQRLHNQEKAELQKNARQALREAKQTLKKTDAVLANVFSPSHYQAATRLIAEAEEAMEREEFRIALEKLSESQKEAQKAQEISEPKKAIRDIALSRVKELVSERKWNEALKECEKILQIGPNDEKAKGYLSLIRKSKEKEINEHLKTAKQYLGAGKYQEAQGECRKILALEPEHQEANALLEDSQRKEFSVHMENGHQYLKENEFEKAFAEFERAYELKTSDAEAKKYLEVSRTLAELTKKRNEAFMYQRFEKAREYHEQINAILLEYKIPAQ